MSLDIDWSLLTCPTSSSLTTSLITSLNSALQTASRPSFIGPITVTAFSFGSAPPDVEIKDIRDPWRVFDEIDEEEEEEEINDDDDDILHGDEFEDQQVSSPLDDEVYDFVSPYTAYEAEMDEVGSVYSGIGSARGSVAAVGLGPGFARRGFMSPSLSLNRLQHQHQYPASTTRIPAIPLSSQQRHPSSRLPRSSNLRPTSSPPPSPPVRPRGLAAKPPSSIPSLQLHLRLSHTSDLTLTLLTSLQVNYPSQLFMSLPLKLSITGLQLAADLVLAYSGDKHRVHICVVDDDDNNTKPSAASVPIGMRLLPHLQIESEIGHADAHVLRNVGKVERFIADVVRKTLVDELVFPNFHTIAL
ncbi:hypothetical protein BCR39DRAFT_544306 [Naematelia encephala]|uniref:Mitochondrial distribution and morphology protein 12 n=1 Tax=Naematelia encephala TaxID=71784 RepID=A0A1Y2ATR2_9TREE|nr:hypothetical protein BCR39DRAFT_544306 [Naematelia encephala]